MLKANGYWALHDVYENMNLLAYVREIMEVMTSTCLTQARLLSALFEFVLASLGVRWLMMQKAVR